MKIRGAWEVYAITKPVRYMSRVFHKGINYSAQGEQALVYFSCFPCTTLHKNHASSSKIRWLFVEQTMCGQCVVL